MATKEYFPGIGKIKFEGVESKNPMAFRYYDAEKVILGKPMKESVEIRYGNGGTHCALKVATSSVAEQKASHGKEILTKYRLQKIK